MSIKVKISFIIKYGEENSEDEGTPYDLPGEGEAFEIIADPVLTEVSNDSILLITAVCAQTLKKRIGPKKTIKLIAKSALGNIDNCPLNTEEQTIDESIQTWEDEDEDEDEDEEIDGEKGLIDPHNDDEPEEENNEDDWWKTGHE